jgi:hypothetical protein
MCLETFLLKICTVLIKIFEKGSSLDWINIIGEVINVSFQKESKSSLKATFRWRKFKDDQ